MGEGGRAIHSLVINNELCELNPAGQVQPGVCSHLIKPWCATCPAGPGYTDFSCHPGETWDGKEDISGPMSTAISVS